MRKTLSPSDIYEVERLSVISSIDKKVIIDLYQPLIGAVGVSLYLSLLNDEHSIALRFDRLLKKCQLSSGELIGALDALEATSLVKTFYKGDDTLSYYCFCLYAPKTPGAFFDDPLFAGTLRELVGGEELERLSKKYATDVEPDYMDDISTSFMSFFAPDVEALGKAGGKLASGKRKTGEANTGFDMNACFEELIQRDERFSRSCFGEKELCKMESLAALYGYAPDVFADMVANSFDWTKAKGRRLNFKALEEEAQSALSYNYLRTRGVNTMRPTDIKGDSPTAHAIRLMEECTPVQYLTRLQKGHAPASSDISLVSHLTSDMGLPYSVTNALILYVIQTNNNVLSAKLAEKIAASLVRSNITTAIDAMDYLAKTGSKKQKKGEFEAKETRDVQKKDAPAKKAEDEDISDEEFDKMMAEL